jgi:2-amino-4-hydroxy-6-hydroxymethyldihydropteridine diphosphokinase
MASEVLVPAYIGLGSNLDDPAAQLRSALAALGRIQSTRLIASSALYRNPPMGPQGQPDFVNAVAALLTRLSPEELMAALRQIEEAHGRRRDGVRWGPRRLDLDLLLYGELETASETLTLPHPGLAQRPFVLIPLHELAPGLRIPGSTTVARLAAAVGDGGLVRLDA